LSTDLSPARRKRGTFDEEVRIRSPVAAAHELMETSATALAHGREQAFAVLVPALQEEKWRRKSEQRDKWNLWASSRAEEGLERRSFRRSRSQRAALDAPTCVHGKACPGYPA
jgi:hypothetical protein